MHDCGFVTGRNMRWQPVDQGFHRVDLFRFTRAVLFGPARDLALEVIARATKVAEPNGCIIDLVERGDDPVHVVEDGGALGIGESGQARVPEDATVNMFHPIERPPDHGFVFAQRHHLRDRNIGAGERLLNAEFPLDGMCRGQEFRCRSRFGAHDPASA